MRSEAGQRTTGRPGRLYAALGIALAGAFVWLGFYAAGDDDYYAPTAVSRWEHADRYVGAPALVAAFSIGVAGVVALLIAPWSQFARRIAFPGVLLALAALLFAWFVLTAGH